MRQRIKLAVQVLSNSESKAIEYCGQKGLMPEHWKKASEMIQIFNAWFDMLNSHSKFIGNCLGRNAYGTDLPIRRDMLQKGILLTNEYLESIYDYLKEKMK